MVKQLVCFIVVLQLDAESSRARSRKIKALYARGAFTEARDVATEWRRQDPQVRSSLFLRS